MTKKEELIRLNELVNASNIYEAMRALDMMLKMYKGSPKVESHRYTVIPIKHQNT